MSSQAPWVVSDNVRGRWGETGRGFVRGHDIAVTSAPGERFGMGSRRQSRSCTPDNFQRRSQGKSDRFRP